MNNSVGLRGSLVRLVPLDVGVHLENTTRWLQDPVVTQYLEHNMPMTRLKEESYFRRMMASATDAIWAVEDLAGVHIGNTTLQHINWKERYATSATLLGDRGSWGKGYALDAGRVKSRYAFDDLGLNRLEAEVFVENTACCRLCERAGWRREGIARHKYFRKGRWHDVARYAILAEDYYHARGDEPQSSADPEQSGRLLPHDQPR